MTGLLAVSLRHWAERKRLLGEVPMPDDDASALDEAGVISAFPDIKVGDIRKIDASTYNAIDVSVGDLLCLPVHVPSTGPRAPAHVTSELVIVPDFD